MSSNNDVTNPAHYTDGSVEFIHAVEAALGPGGISIVLPGECYEIPLAL